LTASNTTESPYSVTFKSGRGTLITVRGDDHEELIERLALASAPVGPDGTLLEMIGSIDDALGGGAASSGGSPAAAAPQGGQGSLSPACKTCGGATQERSGTGRKGPWKGHFCTVNKDHPVNWV
jgi:hypothetical protein